MVRSSRARICAYAVAFAAVVTPIVPAAASASDAFFDPPTSLSMGRPGDVIRSEQVRVASLPGTRAWRVMYQSTTATGEPTAVTGLIVVPRRMRATTPLVGIAPGFPGMADKCAPSKTIPGGTSAELPLMLPLVERGYAIAVTDYEGMGTPGDHRYVVGASEAHDVLDVMRAARRFAPAGIPADSPAVLSGYSQGGHAAMMTAELQSDYAPDVPLRGVAAGGLPGDFEALADYMDGTLFSPLLMAVAIAYDAAYPELDLDAVLTPRGRRIRDQIRRGCITDILTGPGAFVRSSSVTTIDLLKDPAWLARLRSNLAGTRKPPMPLYLYHARADEGLPFAQALATRNRYCALGAKVQWRELHFTEHATGALVGIPHVVRWLDARLRGEPEPGTCPPATAPG